MHRSVVILATLVTMAVAPAAASAQIVESPGPETVTLNVRSYDNTISTRVGMTVLSAEDLYFHVTVVIQRYSRGSWISVKRLPGGGDFQKSNSTGIVKMRQMRLRHQISRLQRRLRQGVRYRVLLEYQVNTNQKDVIAKGQAKRSVKAEK